MAEILLTSLRYARKKHFINNSKNFTLLVVIVILTLVQSTLAFDYTSSSSTIRAAICSADQFQCKDGNCILQEKMCDGRRDCLDNSDEIDCDMKLCREPHWFQCAQPHGPCLSSDLACNGIENCPGGEDEQNCAKRQRTGMEVLFGGDPFDWLQKRQNCSQYEYTCQSDKSCIPLDFMCDGKSDCRDNSDETAGCIKAKSNCRGFFCENKRKCLESFKWLCDGVDDCGDGSDERNCTSNCKTDQGKYLCRDSTTCVALEKVCDGKGDCPDGSDESSRCTLTSDNCSTRKCPPAAKCQMLPETGPICVCPKGYRYSVMQHSCIDINECVEIFGVCSQNCENKVGSYICTCDPGYQLRSDNSTCVAQGEDALLLYTTQVAVVGVHLAEQRKRIFTVVKNLTKVIGVAFDGGNIYWTNIQSEAESIVKAKPDGTQQEILLTSGLDAPEDLAVDWLTGNIYFSDNVLRHIAVCSNDGLYCVVLVTVDVHQPRGIALWPQRAQIFWSDWGVKPMIARASMDGSNSLPIVTDNLHWPNGIALDMHNDRIYWVDAKYATIESARSDGTDRRIVLDEILKHPYGLAVFEDKLYWSDWSTKSIHMCNKFTGKDHRVINKDRTIYAVHVYHSAKQPKVPHACEKTRCSHMCLLAEGNKSTCACPDGMQLSEDQLRCIKTEKRQKLYIGLKNSLLEIEHTAFGRHVISQSHHLPTYISEMAFNSVNGTVFVADNVARTISEYDAPNNKFTPLVNTNLGNITGLAFDYMAHNLYWTDSARHVVEVFSMNTRQRAIVNFFSGMEAPIGLTVIPEDGVMFIALRARRQVHIDQLPLNGQGKHMHVFEDELGNGEIKFVPDYETRTLYWADSDYGRISFSDYRIMHAYTFRGRLRKPYSIAIVDDELFWTELHSTTIHWTHKSNLGPLKRIEIEASKDAFMIPTHIPLTSSTRLQHVEHMCQNSNGGCSHVCVSLRKSAACLCPPGLVFRDSSNRTCIEALDCEFRCQSGECLTQSRRCNGRKDCPDGSDEEGCDPENMKSQKIVCVVGKFMCHDAKQCVEAIARCDGRKDCSDGSDEEHCANFDKSKMCHRHQHACDNGNCVDFSVMCDGIDDCGDSTDEINCKSASGKNADQRPVCGKDMFQCNSGTCIAKNWECDGKLDCMDGSDEHEKCGLKECPKNMHKCLLGQCIDARLVCDQHNDCGDHSDELNCDYEKGARRNATCNNKQRPMYQCPSDGNICLELTAKCNGTAECPRGEDEADCGGICSIYEFQCKSSKECIRKEFHCDHEKDCPDGSDEVNCKSAGNGTSALVGIHTNEQFCEANMFDCHDGECVDQSRVCDGFPDCETNADEGPQCNTACKPTSGRQVCAHKCRPTPTGAECSCFHGYKLDADRRNCLDINECDELDPCSQVCENTHGSYRCSCYPDFMLRPDKTTCKSIESESSLLFSTYNEVRRMSEHPITLTVAWSANDSKVNGFDINIRKRAAYFSTDSEDILYMVDMDSNTIKAGLTVDMPTKVAVDWVTENVYVISRTQRYEIRICSFAAKMCGRIIQANPRETIKALTVDAYNRRLFYVILHASSFGATMSQIMISHLDGNRREILFTKNEAFITAITIDPYKKLLYYVDSHSKTLEAVSYKIGSSRTSVNIIRKGNVVVHPSGLTIYENQAFIVNIGAKEAIRCRLYGSKDCKPFNLNVLNAEDIVVDGVSRQPITTNPCELAKCSGMCIQAEYGYECMCGDSVVNENVICTETNTHAVSSSALLSQQDESNESSFHITTMLLIFLMLASIGAGVGYMYYQRIRQGHRDFNINLHFQNPLSSFGGSKTSTMYSNGSGGSGSGARSNGSGATSSSFLSLRGKSAFGTPICRFFGNSTSKGCSEIVLETAGTKIDFNTLEANRKIKRVPSVLVEDDSDSDLTRTSGHHDDDARAKLVP